MKRAFLVALKVLLPVEMTQGTLRSSQDPDDYEELEDPFAGSSGDIPILSDPLEGYNRWMFGVNETIYQNVLEPVARGYRDTVHENLRLGIKNIFSNAMAPVKLSAVCCSWILRSLAGLLREP